MAKVKFNFLNLILMLGSGYYLSYEMIKVGVPDAIVIPFNIFYCLLFPLRFVTIVEDPAEGEANNDTNKTDQSDN